ncbi:hypothetical protein [Bradyrhizobium sp. 139]|uniref:hypothetical protein n=1 Tax=Bradyrhizobium sp. 139 TaxID=2782616 RepID=UPI0031FE6C42
MSSTSTSTAQAVWLCTSRKFIPSFTIGRVAEDLGENEDWPWDVANGMDLEDGVIRVYGIGDDGVMAFTDLGIENLIELIRIHKEDPELLKRRNRSSIVRGLVVREE